MGDFHQRQLFFQSCDKSIQQPKPLKMSFTNDINLKQVDRQPFGKMNERQIQEKQKTHGIGGYQKKTYEYTNYNEVKGILSYDSALQFRKENVPEKINKVKLDTYHKPQEYVARNITYQMNKEKMFGVNWALGDDSTQKNAISRASQNRHRGSFL